MVKTKLKQFQDLIPKITELQSNGLSLNKISKEIGWSFSTLRLYMKHFELGYEDTRSMSKTINELLGQEIIHMAKQGLPLVQISEKTGIIRGNITNFLNKNGIKLSRSKTNRISPEIKEAFLYKHLDLVNKEIALGKTKNQISKQHNILYTLLTRMEDVNLVKFPKPKIYKYETVKERKDILNPSLTLLTDNPTSGFYKVQCKIHLDQIYERSIHDFHYGCIICNNRGVSKPELEIIDFLKSIGVESQHNVRYGRSFKRVDVLCEQVGIEYNGLYYHSETSLMRGQLRRKIPEGTLDDDEYRLKQIKTYHKLKMTEVNEAGYRLITIFEDEWKTRKTQICNYLKSVFNKNENTVYARKCTIAIIDADLARFFLEKNHIQGPAKQSTVYIGIHYKDDLIGVMSLGKHHRSNVNKTSIVLDRLAFKDNYNVTGGSSRLFKFAKDWARSNGYTKIISWSDNRWSEGNVYKALGFKLDAELGPDYAYVKNGKRHSKQSLKKTPEERLTGKTESQLRIEQGYDRIWDCGKKRWIFDIESGAI